MGKQLIPEGLFFVVVVLFCFLFFFSAWVFFHENSRFTGWQGKGEAISLTPLYHFHPLERYLHSRAIEQETFGFLAQVANY